MIDQSSFPPSAYINNVDVKTQSIDNTENISLFLNMNANKIVFTVWLQNPQAASICLYNYTFAYSDLKL